MVAPAASASAALSGPAGMPTMKSPMCGWIVAASPSAAQSSSARSGPVSFGTRCRSAGGRLIARLIASPKRSTGATPASASACSISRSAAAVLSQSVRPMWMCHVMRPAARAASFAAASLGASCARR